MALTMPPFRRHPSTQKQFQAWLRSLTNMLIATTFSFSIVSSALAQTPSDGRTAQHPATTLYERAVANKEAGQQAQAEAMWEKLIASYKEDNSPSVQKQVILATLGLGEQLILAGHPKRALDYLEAQWLLGDARKSQLDKAYAPNIHFKIVRAYQATGNKKIIRRACQDFINRYKNSSNAQIQQWVARTSMIYIGTLSSQRKKLALYADVIERYRTSQDPIIMQCVAGALSNTAAYIGMANIPHVITKNMTELQQRFGTSSQPLIRFFVSRAFMIQARALLSQNKRAEAQDTLQHIISTYSGQKELDRTRINVGRAHYQLGNFASDSGQYLKAAHAYAKAYEAAHGAKHRSAVRLEVMALLNSGKAFDDADHDQEAIKTYNLLINRYQHITTPEPRAIVALGQVYKAVVLANESEYTNALNILNRAIDRYEGFDDDGMTLSMGTAHCTKGQILMRLGKLQAAKTEFEASLVKLERSYGNLAHVYRQVARRDYATVLGRLRKS